ncbi:MAG: hypothetical protein Q9160_001212 [Pyrenula sp. 1 TL-2023]
MSSFLLTAILSIFLASSVSAQFVTPPTDLKNTTGYANVPVRYKEVPNGICETNPDVKSYSGYADIAPDQHIFFWFFESRRSPSTDPISVWINGGPGSSSMIGLFQELGPCGIDSEGNVYNNPYAWNEVSNMLFIDQPTTTGLSYSIPVAGYTEQGDFSPLPNGTCPEGVTTCGTYSTYDTSLTPNSTVNAAAPFYLALQGILGSDPIKPYTSNGFNFATESYGGHYGPVFSAYIVSQNKAIAANVSTIPNAAPIDLKSLLIGNGWFSPILQYPSYYNYTVTPGNTYLKPFYNSTSTEELMFDATYGAGNCTDQLTACAQTGDDTTCSNADDFCYSEVEVVFDDYSGRDEYDSRELTPDPFPYNYYPDYLNSPSVQTAIGATVNFSDSSNIVGAAFASTGDDARDPDTAGALSTLVASGVNVILYVGDADYICNWVGVEAFANLVSAPGYADAGYTDISSSDGRVHGQVKQSNNFAFVRTYEAGHEVPFYQPVVSLEMFERSYSFKDVATGETDLGPDYATSGTPTTTFFEGPGTVQFEVLPENSTYNTETDQPDGAAAVARQARLRLPKREESLRKRKEERRADQRSTVQKRWSKERRSVSGVGSEAGWRDIKRGHGSWVGRGSGS